eukprot:SAG11_NODE_4464_length_1886_cov_2.049804_1_plen_101_part_00
MRLRPHVGLSRMPRVTRTAALGLGRMRRRRWVNVFQETDEAEERQTVNPDYQRWLSSLDRQAEEDTKHAWTCPKSCCCQDNRRPYLIRMLQQEDVDGETR